MTESRSTIEQIAAQAAEIDSLEARAAFLDVACVGDTAMRGAVESEVSRLDTERVTMAGPLASVRIDLGSTRGDPIGRYRLIGRLGEGGFGVVWRAEQTEPVRREVALKLIKPGMDSAAVLARFEAERQALAVMDHPCIARVFDGGVTERGLPYFVMELVRGMPISDFCDTHKLSIAERIGLFIQVCEAVQHAHMKGVVHRDLKPSNILVAYDAAGDPRPKVIDFGIAKALNQRLAEATIFTEQGQMIGTPEYMSPEQAEMSGLDIDTRSDVYSLGVMLYELLTGGLPFDPKQLRAAGYAEIQRIIREVNPPRPSNRLSTVGENEQARTNIIAARQADLRDLTTTLRRDLDWIVMRCLEKERSRRYDAASDIADELRRYLNHEPVEAGPPSAAYRVRKFIRRNRAGVAAGSLVAAALVAAVVGTTWGMLWALAERDRAGQAESAAEARAAELELVSAFQSSQLSGVDAASMGEGIRDGLLRQLRDSLRLSGADNAEIAAGESALEEQLRGTNFTTLSVQALDEEIFVRALRAIERDFAEQPLLRATLLQTIATTLQSLGMLDRATLPQEQALSLRRAALGEDHPDTLASMSKAGSLLEAQGRMEQAETLIRAALDAKRRVLGDEHPSTLTEINNLGALLKAQGRLDEAEPLYREALDAERRVLGDDHPEMVALLNNMGQLLRAQDKMAEAEPFFREALETARRTMGNDSTTTLTLVNNMGGLLRAQRRLDEAEPYYREAVEGLQRVLGDDHLNTLTAYNNLSGLLLNQGKTAEAEPYARKALEGLRRVLGDEHPRTLTAVNGMGALLKAQGRLEEAEPYYREAIESRRRVLGPQHPDTLTAINNLAILVEAEGRLDEAETFYREALGGRRRALGDAHFSTLASLRALAQLLIARSDPATAEPLALEYETRVREDQGPESPATLDAAQLLAKLYEAWHEAEPHAGHGADAARWRAKLPPTEIDDAEPGESGD